MNGTILDVESSSVRLILISVVPFCFSIFNAMFHPVVRKKCCLLLSRTQWKLWVNFLPRETPFFVVKTVGIFDSLTTELAVVLPVLSNRNQRNCAIVQTIIIEFDRKQTVKDRLLQWGTAIILCYVSSHFEVWSGRFFWF